MKTPTAIPSLLALASSVALLSQNVDAHGYISQPKGKYTGGSSYTSYSAEITASINGGFDGIYNRSPEQNAAEFTADWPNTGYSSLRAMLDTVVSGCGYTTLDTTAIDVSSMSTMKYQNDEYKEGFLSSHHGPCEAWIDDTKVFHYDDCVASFPAYPAEIPVDYSSCSGSCTFRFYWLALHSSNWQVYKGCVPITKGSGGGNVASEADTTTTTTSNSTTTTASTTPMSTTATPTPSTTAPTSNPYYNGGWGHSFGFNQ